MTQFAANHRIAGITFRTESDVLIPHLQQAPIAWFRVDDGKPDVRNRIRQLDLDSLSLPPLSSEVRERLVCSMNFPQRWLDSPIFRSPAVYTILQRCLEQPEMAHIALIWNRAIFRNFARNELDLFYPPEKRADFGDPIFVAGYRNLLDTFLPNFSAVMIHGAGVIRRGMAAMFLAPDGGGKTTVVTRSGRAPVLSDDHLILRQEGDGILAHATPLGTITSGPQQARLGGLFVLEKAARFELTPIKPRDVLRVIWNERQSRWYVWPNSLRLRTFDILHAVCRQAPAYRMRFPRDHVDWDAIDAAMLR